MLDDLPSHGLPLHDLPPPVTGSRDRAVVVTGLGALTPAGLDREATGAHGFDPAAVLDAS